MENCSSICHGSYQWRWYRRDVFSSMVSTVVSITVSLHTNTGQCCQMLLRRVNYIMVSVEKNCFTHTLYFLPNLVLE